LYAGQRRESGVEVGTNFGIVFQNQKGHRLKLSEPVVVLLKEYEQTELGSPEAGGILLGRYLKNSNDVVVDQVTVPMPGDQRKRNWFFRASFAHQIAIDQAWCRSSGTCNYLGGWHTHPENNPSPSLTDILDWRKRFLFDRIDSKFLCFVIVGIGSINAWQVGRRLLQVERLQLCG
jgi:integrative and conjugative element protein (TIGR02256 family)